MDVGELAVNAVARMAVTEPSRVLIQDADGGRRNYREVHLAGLRWAHALELAGAAEGDNVAVMLPTSIDAFLVQQGLGWLNGTVVSINTMLRGALLARALTITESTVLVTTPSLYAEVAALGTMPERLRSVVVLGTVAPQAIPGYPVLTAAELLEAAESRPRRGPGPADVQGIIFTSGTTGPSKAVQLSHEFFTICARGLIPGGGDAIGGAYYNPWPMAHSLGSLALAAGVDRGVRVVVRSGFKVDTFWRDVREFDCRTAVLVSVGPTVWKAPARHDDAVNPLRHVSLAPLIPEYQQFASRFGVEISSMYGMTEIGPVLVAGDPPDHRIAGRPVDGYEFRVVDPAGKAVADGSPGELLVRHPEEQRLFTGYAGMPEETAAAVRGGWFHTGDLFVRRTTGDFEFLDRLKDSIRRRGRNISSFEIEAEAAAHPDVMQCAAVGIPSEDATNVAGRDEEVKLFMVLRPSAQVTAAGLAQYLADRLPRYMVPRYLEFVTEIPVGTTSRPVKSVLRTYPNTAATFDRAAHHRERQGADA